MALEIPISTEPEVGGRRLQMMVMMITADTTDDDDLLQGFDPS